MKNLIFISICIILPLFGFSQESCYPSSNSPLINYFVQALDNGDTAKMELYLNSGITINGTYCGSTAAYKGYFKTQAGQYKQSGSGFQKPFIMRAVENKNTSVLKFMINKGANVNKFCLIPVTKYDKNAGYQGSPNQWVAFPPVKIYPLNIAINKDFSSITSKEIIKILLDKGADPNVAIWDAQTTNDLHIMNLFTDQGAKFNYSATDLYGAMEKNNKSAFDFYIKSGVKADCNCFIYAAKTGDIVKLQLFLNQGCNINCNSSYSALCYAIFNSDLNTIKFLVENGADLNSRCIWHDGALDPQGKNQSLAEYAEATGYEKNRAKPNVTEYLLLAPAVQKKALDEKQNNIKKYRADAEAFIIQGKIEDAKVSYNKAYALSRDKKDQDGVVVYFRDKGSNSFNKTHNYDSAAYYYSQAYKLSNMNIDKYYYTNSCFELGKYDDAIKNCNELLLYTDISKDYIYRMLGLCYEKKRKIDDANINYKKSLEFVRENNYYQKSGMYSLLNEKENAIANLKKAFENGFKDFEYLNNDHDFDNISKSEEFIKLVNKYKKKLLK